MRSNNNKTIIIDPWLGIADYASNIIPKLKNQYKNHFVIEHDDIIGFLPKINLSAAKEKDIIIKEFPSLLIAKEDGTNLMQIV